MHRPRRAIYAFAAAGGFLCLLLLFGAAMWRALDRAPAPAAMLPAPASSDAAARSFSLVAADGRTVTEHTFRGRWQLVYFGYTACPDVCPTTLNAMADALARLGKRADSVQPLFVTVDPTRDTPSLLAGYLANFDARILALTGTPAEIEKAAQAFGASFERGQNGAGGYLVDHSAFVYVVDPGGKMVGRFAPNTLGDEMAKELIALMSPSA